MGFLSNIFKSIKQHTKPRFVINKDINSVQILLESNHEQYFTLEFNTLVPKEFNSQEANSTSLQCYNKDLKNIYIENIDLGMNVQWSGSAGGHFQQFIYDEFNTLQLQCFKSIDKDFYRFSKYKGVNNIEVGIVWLSFSSEDIFIFDDKGKLFNDLLKIYGFIDDDMVIDEKENNLIVKNSMMNNNIVNSYFQENI